MPETTINDTIIAILHKLVSERSLLPQEQAMLDNWVAGSEHKKALLEELRNEDRLFDEIKKRYAFNTADEWLKMVEKLRTASPATAAPLVADSENTPQHALPAHRVHFLKTAWFRYAAAIIVVAGGTAIWYQLSQPRRLSSPQGISVAQADIQPGTNRATLTIDNNKVDLSSDKTGITVGNGIAYTDGEKIANAGQLLTLATPRGGQYQALLPDGSKVWLNAASSIRFPSRFEGNQRSVEVSGEVYMEVAKNARKSFVVKVNGLEIQVLGTSFNVNAYSDEEAIKTTLVDGSVRVTRNVEEDVTQKGVHVKSEVLKPGQQAVVGLSQMKIQTVSIEEVLAWRNGIFNFNNVDIKGMMRQLSRWYDVEVSYEGKIPERIFEGKMQRNIPLSSALKILELNKINFRVEGRKIIVVP